MKNNVGETIPRKCTEILDWYIKKNLGDIWKFFWKKSLHQNDYSGVAE